MVSELIHTFHFGVRFVAKILSRAMGRKARACGFLQRGDFLTTANELQLGI
jgi:hypothetical protein